MYDMKKLVKQYEKKIREQDLKIHELSNPELDVETVSNQSHNLEPRSSKSKYLNEPASNAS